ncbi:MAG: sulfite exporter TauE/SafE family protein [Raoultibacter sp.]
MFTFIVAACVGVVVGILSGLLGIGGGTVMVPVFRLGFGLSAIEAAATSLFTIIPTSLAGCVTHIRNKTCRVPLGVAAGLGGACTSPVGVWLASISPSWAIMAAAALIIGYSAISMLKKARALPKPEKKAAAKKGAACVGASASSVLVVPPAASASAPASTPTPTSTPALAPQHSAASFTKSQLFKGALIGLAAGVASGYVGVGGGFIMVPLFISVVGISMRHASGTSLIAVTILAIPGAIAQALLGNVDFIAGAAMAVGSIPGALLGASLMRRVPDRTLRFLFGGFLIFVAILLVVNEFIVL